MSALQEARRQQDQLRRSTEARIAADRAELEGETARSLPEERLRTRIEERERFLELVEAGDWPGIRLQHRAALQNAPEVDAEAAADGREGETRSTPRPPRPKVRERPSGRLEGGESDTDRAVRMILEAGEPRERQPAADPDVERAAEFIKGAGQDEGDVDEAVELIKSAGRS